MQVRGRGKKKGEGGESGRERWRGYGARERNIYIYRSALERDDVLLQEWEGEERDSGERERERGSGLS